MRLCGGLCASLLLDGPGTESPSVTGTLLVQWLKCSFEAFSMQMMTKLWSIACIWPDSLRSEGKACCFVWRNRPCFRLQLIAGDAVGRVVCHASVRACFILGLNRAKTRDVLHVELILCGA